MYNNRDDYKFLTLDFWAYFFHFILSNKMYHYVVIRKDFFFFILLFSCFLLNDSFAIKSPREKWNYQKKEDKIKHHTINVKIKSNIRDTDDRTKNKNSELLQDAENSSEIDSTGEGGGKKIERPGSPRDRW